MSEKSEKRILKLILPLIAVLMLLVWSVKPHADETRIITSKDGTWDLTHMDLMQEKVKLSGTVEYVPNALLSHQDFSKRDDFQLGQPGDAVQYATSRMHIKVPQGSYLICGSRVDFASRMYVNGTLVYEAGKPGSSRKQALPGVEYYVVPAVPDANGDIVIVQQVSNFTHKDGGTHGTLYLGAPRLINQYVTRNEWPEAVLMGGYLLLFLVHLILFLMIRGYKPNLLFSLFCLTWFIRTGVSGQRLLGAVFPALSWTTIFRLEYLTMPISGILLVWLLYQLFPSILPRRFVLAATFFCACFAAIDLFGPTLLMSYTAICRIVILGLIGLYFFIRLIKYHSHMNSEQAAVLSGFVFLLIAAVWDMLYHRDIYILPAMRFAISEMAVAVFVLYSMTAMFFGTMQEVRKAKEGEERMSAERDMLEELNHLKNQFYTDMSHEMKTPLTVISVNAQFVAQNIESGTIDKETIADVTAISTEAKRLAQMVTSLVGLGQMQGTTVKEHLLSVNSLVEETVRIYQSMFARQKNVLTAQTDPHNPSVEGNADQLIQVLINLLSNANRHTENGRVVVSIEKLTNEVRVNVTDNGSGIEADLLPHVFERYQRGEEGVTGLGLTICKKIIEEHHGKIGIESVIGKGTQVWFTLPVKEDA